MKKKLFIFLIVFSILSGGIVAYRMWQDYKIPPAPPVNYSEIEPVVLSMTSSLSSFLKINVASSSRTIENFGEHIKKTKRRNFFLISSFTLELEHKGNLGILIIKDKKTNQLLFEDGTWPADPSLDAPHWRKKDLPRLKFPDE